MGTPKTTKKTVTTKKTKKVTPVKKDGNLYSYTPPKVKAWVVEQAKKKNISTSEYICSVFEEKYNRSKAATGKKTSTPVTTKVADKAA